MSGQYEELYEISKQIKHELREFDEAISRAQDQLFALANVRRLIGAQAQKLEFQAYEKEGRHKLVISLSCPNDETDSH